MRTRINEAMRLAQAGRLGDARYLLQEIVQDHPDSVEAHSLLGTLAFRENDYEAALAACKNCVALEPDNFSLHLNLGMVREASGDASGAISAYLKAFRLNPQDARPALFAGAALEAAGHREDAAVMFTLGDDVSTAVRTAKDQPGQAVEIRERSATADRVMREHFSRLHEKSVDEAERMIRENSPDGTSPDLSRLRHSIWVQTHIGDVEFRTPRQAPGLFYVPDLEAVPIVPNERLPWAEQVEALAEEIRQEYLAAVGGGAELAPYVHANMPGRAWQKLKGSGDWASLHLYQGGEPTEIARLFPRTLEAMEAADTIRVGSGTPIEVFFSRLKPGAHIPPHMGQANNRLTVHLPLIVPDRCAIRVCDEEHVWREGELFAFDDSFEHEAWNDSDSDRVVLIFEAHHPDLRPEEREAIEHVFNVRRSWLKERRIPEWPEAAAAD